MAEALLPDSDCCLLAFVDVELWLPVAACPSLLWLPMLPEEPELCPLCAELPELPLWFWSDDVLEDDDCANASVATTSTAAQLNNNFFMETPTS